MKKFLSFLMVSVLAILCFACVGCKSNSKLTESSVVGTYKLQSMSYGGITITAGTSADGYMFTEDYCVLDIFADKTFTIAIKEEGSDTGTWKISSNKLILTDSEGEDQEATLKNGVLTMKMIDTDEDSGSGSGTTTTTILKLKKIKTASNSSVTEESVVGTYKSYMFTNTENNETSTIKATDGDTIYNEDFEVYTINADKTYNLYFDNDLLITGTWELKDKKIILTSKSTTATENTVKTMNVDGDIISFSQTDTVSGNVRTRVWRYKKVSSTNIYASASN